MHAIFEVINLFCATKILFIFMFFSNVCETILTRRIFTYLVCMSEIYLRCGNVPFEPKWKVLGFSIESESYCDVRMNGSKYRDVGTGGQRGQRTRGAMAPSLIGKLCKSAPYKSKNTPS